MISNEGRLAQLVRARASHVRGRRFESCNAQVVDTRDLHLLVKALPTVSLSLSLI